jgi:predicted Zn finger-like uncharacterized protein
MIAVCPKCKARYRIAREKLRPEGVRVRCARCAALFKVRRPEVVAAQGSPAEPLSGPALSGEAPPRAAAQSGRGEARPAPAPPSKEAAPAPPERSVLVAMPGEDLAKQTAELLAGRGLHAVVVHDGVEAMLEIQRRLPRAVVLSATLPRMYGFQICEIVKRNESLRAIFVVLAGAIHHRERYRRPPGDLYGADAYLEEPDLPEGLPPLLERAGIPLEPLAPSPSPPPAAPVAPARAPAPAASEAGPVAPALAGAAPAAPVADDGLGELRARAERLARIIVSDIVLYNEEKFAEAVRRGTVREVMGPDLEEGRGLFRERVDPRVRAERDHLMEELLRVASRRAAG